MSDICGFSRPVYETWVCVGRYLFSMGYISPIEFKKCLIARASGNFLCQYLFFV